MRLTPEEVAGITTAVAEVFGPTATVRLFGSRVRDDLKGGDIDLLVEVPPGRETFADECALGLALTEYLGDRKVDILLVMPGRPLAPIEQIAFREGQIL
jgi:predicted nucleotidyltransferase